MLHRKRNLVYLFRTPTGNYHSMFNKLHLAVESVHM